MKIQHIAFALTVINLTILTILLAQFRPAHAQQVQQQNVAPVLRGRALEIIDSSGKVRASISILPPVVVAGKTYPETVLLRLIESHGKPLVKLGAAENGSALALTDEADEGVVIHGHTDGSFVKITNKGKVRVMEP